MISYWVFMDRFCKHSSVFLCVFLCVYVGVCVCVYFFNQFNKMTDSVLPENMELENVSNNKKEKEENEESQVIRMYLQKSNLFSKFLFQARERMMSLRKSERKKYCAIFLEFFKKQFSSAQASRLFAAREVFQR